MVPEDEMSKIAATLCAPQYKHILILADEIYDRLVYEPAKFVSCIQIPELVSRTLYVNGFSKTFAMCGYRVGYVASKDTGALRAIIALQSQITSCPSALSQHVARAALSDPHFESWLGARLVELRRKRDVLCGELATVKALKFTRPSGTFYVMVDVQALLPSRTPAGILVHTSADFCSALLSEGAVALVPGECFGYPGVVRIAFATTEDTLKRAATKLKAFVSSLRLEPHRG